MPCAELTRLRDEVRRLREELQQRRHVARAKTGLSRGGFQSGQSDYEPFLQRRILKATADLEQHLAEHRCSD